MKDTLPWAEKHKPKNTKEITGQSAAVVQVCNFIKEYKKDKSPMLLHGPTGTGKTALVYAAANEFDFEIIEMNASDFRTSSAIKEKIGHAVTQQSLVSKKGKIILVDEVEGIHGNSDRGGLPEIYRIFDETNYPIILTANDVWNPKLKNLRKKCSLAQFNKIDLKSASEVLKKIAEKEGITVEDSVLYEISRRSEGDLRAAINDLQSIAIGVQKVTLNNLKNLDSRIKKTSIFDVLMAIFKTKDLKIINDAMWRCDKNPEEILLWLVENIPKEYEKPDEIAKAFEALSRADVFSGRIYRQQAWSLLRFSSEMMSYGVAAAKQQKYSKFTKYQPPSILIKMGRSKFKRAIRNSAAEKIGKNCHCSKKRAVEQFPYFSIMAKKGINFELEESETEYLKKFT